MSNYTTDDIKVMIVALNQIGTSIINANNILYSIPDPKLKHHYSWEVTELISLFNEESLRVRKIIEDYLVREKELNLPVDLSIRKVYQTLKEM